jgi:hypothetical protein
MKQLAQCSCIPPGTEQRFRYRVLARVVNVTKQLVAQSKQLPERGAVIRLEEKAYFSIEL